MTTFIIFLLVLGVLVVAHEFGHFWAARRGGVRVDEFGFGFPPRILWKKVGETIYSFNLFPLGGFVRIFGEDMEEGMDDPRSFGSKSTGIRARIVAAGVIMNLLLAIVIFSINSTIGIPSVIDEKNERYARDIGVQVIGVAKNSPAEIAGFKTNDKIIGVKFGEMEEAIDDASLIQRFISEHKGHEIILSVKRNDDVFDIKATPRLDPPLGEGALGIAMAKVGLVSYPVYLAPLKGVEFTAITGWNFIESVYVILKSMIVDGKVIGEIAGPVGIFSLTGQAAQMGIVYLLQFVAILSVNLAIINALPFPALDGGRLLFIAIERIKGSPISIKGEKYAHVIGFALLILLMILITYKDIARFF